MLSPAQHYYVSALVTSIAAFVFGVFVFLKSPNRRLANHFVWYAYTISHWSFFVFACTVVTNHGWSYTLAQVCHLIGVFIPVAFLHFAVVLVKNNSRNLFRIIKVSYVIVGTIALAIFFRPRSFISDVVPKLTFNFFPSPGPLFYVWTIVFVSLVILASAVLLSGAFKTAGIARKRLLFFLIANSLGYLGGIGCFFPVYNIHFFPFPYGIWGVFFFVCVSFYTVLRYQFIDIEVIVKKTLIYACLSSFIIACYSIPLFILPRFFAELIGDRFQLWLLVVAGMIAAALLGPLNRMLLNVTDKYLFQKKFNYRRILKVASEGLASVNSLSHQLRLVVHFLTMRVRIRSAAIYLPENGSNHFFLKTGRPVKTMAYPKQIEYDSPILLYLKAERKKAYLEYYSLEEEARKYARKASYTYNLPRMLEEMRALHGQLIVPSFFQDQLQGILVLGKKKSDDFYNDEDIHLFQTIAQESAIAFENARKHDVLIEKNAELAKINEELKKTQDEVIQAREAVAVSAVSAGISHEVGNNMVGLTGAVLEIDNAFEHALKVIKRYYQSGERLSDTDWHELLLVLKAGRAAVSDVRQTSENIEDVVTTLSQMAKGKHAKMTRISLRVFLKRTVQQSTLLTYGDRLKSQALEKPPELDLDKDLPPIKGNTELLNSVFLNLFKNAIYAMNGVSPKKLKIKALRDPQDSEVIRVEFSDNGKGIPPAVLPKIFDYGFTTKGAEGEGKGLYNVKKIIEEHSGTIDVESETGQGTTFIIKIPIYKE